MEQSENDRNLELIRAAQAKQQPTTEIAGSTAFLAPKEAISSPKQKILEIALRMVVMARYMPTPGVTDTFTNAKQLVEDAGTLSKIAEEM